ncbi:MAG: zinc-ribbon domain-containing protein [Anaeromicrobium sp.]|jgi:hypothetical protein|uniref:zinc-ribbon domain-containing protein n=1 Tax=Anaeromicrobium sp. TaxID=1929132 RepID=UPI0025CE5E3D|nr:zinc-ribbon domain-containing protein [Anaeromicrobium sp.]MCT4594029.1 zinc-ribbon domain-containing protein [Anaeromicrobium sp.]
MSIFNKVKKGMIDSTKVIKDISFDVTEMTKLKMGLSKDMASLDSLYYDLGKALYKDFKKYNIENLSEESLFLLEEMNKIDSRIEESKNTMDQLKGIFKCSQCQFQLDDHVNYCPNCGHPIKDTCNCKDGNKCDCDCNCGCEKSQKKEDPLQENEDFLEESLQVEECPSLEEDKIEDNLEPCECEEKDAE